MAIYDYDALMQQTRKLAADYYQTTQQTLPVSHEIGKYDAMRLLKLTPPTTAQNGIDAFDDLHTPLQIKVRAIFNAQKNNYRIGQLNFDSQWQALLVVLLDDTYETTEMYRIDRILLEAEMTKGHTTRLNPRGAVTVAKLRIIGSLVWSNL